MHFDENNFEKKIVTFVNIKKILCLRSWAATIANSLVCVSERYAAITYEKHNQSSKQYLNQVNTYVNEKKNEQNNE